MISFKPAIFKKCLMAPFNLRENLKKTPLHNACKSWSTLPVAVLLNCGVDLEAVDIRGYTALHMACKEGNDAICNILLENGADPNAYGGPKYFRTPLHRARTKKVVSLDQKVDDVGIKKWIAEFSANFFEEFWWISGK